MVDVGGWLAPRSGRVISGNDGLTIEQEGGCASGSVWTGAENLADPRTVQPVANCNTDCSLSPGPAVVMNI